MEFTISFSRPGKSEILVWVMESHRKLLTIIFPRTTKQEMPRTNDHFLHYFENNFSILGHGKHQKSPGKGHGKSWNFIKSKAYKPC